MKIDSNIKSLIPGAVSSSRPRQETGSARGAELAAEVQISTSSRLSGSGGSAPVDSARIAEIKAAIKEGRFTINPGAIADGLIDTARDLLQSQRRA